MNIQELKNQIESHSITDEIIIMKDSESGFISNQYINEISKVRNLPINYVDSIDGLLIDSGSIFSSDSGESKSSLNVLKSEVFIWEDSSITRLKDAIIVVSRFNDKSQEALFESHVVSIPKIESWMWKDYVYSVAEGVSFKDLDWLITLCGNNYFRLQQELDKLMLFNTNERKYVFDSMVQDGAFDDLSSYNIFNFTNAIISKDIDSIRSIYKELSRMDVNEFGLLTILLKNFRNLIMVQLNSNPTPETTGMEAKQLYAVKKLPKCFSAQQLINVYVLLLDIDRQIKVGELSTEYLIDYLIVKILSM